MSSKATLEIIGRTYCHLCTDMEAEVKARIAGLSLTLTWLDLDEHEELEPLYGEHIPVLRAEGQEICRHRLDHARLDAFLARFS
jgi:hypothetical protein